MDRVFVATGRRPCIDGLDLDAAGIRTGMGAVIVDKHLRTSSKSAWGVGDVAGGLHFTHVAEHMAKVALRNSVLPAKTKIRYDSVPWVTYTDPEVAHIGMSEDEAADAGGTTYRYEMDDLDRAIVDGSAVGFVKISADRKGKVIGATIVAHGAGDLLMPLVLAKQHGLSLSKDRQHHLPLSHHGRRRKAGGGRIHALPTRHHIGGRTAQERSSNGSNRRDAERTKCEPGGPAPANQRARTRSLAEARGLRARSY